MTIASDSIAIIGFGYSGLMVLANLLREAARPLTIYVIDPALDARGAAYSTNQPLHLLNVVACRMGAWAEAPEDFLRWLESEAGKAACAAHQLPHYTAEDFVPRLMYGAYLQSIWREAQALAVQKNCTLKLVQSRAVAIHKTDETLAITTERGDAIAAGQVVLALGNETKKLYPHLPQTQLVQRPWDVGALDACIQATSIAIVGTGLTAIDTVLSLRALGYVGSITALSRSGRLPRAHAAIQHAYTFDRTTLLSHATSLASLLHFIRQTIRTHGDWRAVVDGLRPHTQTLWRKLSTPDKQRFFTRLASIWGIHRHRMAPQIAAMLDAETELQIIAAPQLRATHANNCITLHWWGGSITPDRIINCTGVALDMQRSANPLITQLLAEQWIEPHATSIGIAMDPNFRAYGRAHSRIYAIGGLLTGALLETIAVPELRGQAQGIARSILQICPSE